MTRSPYLDPVTAASSLLDHITGRDGSAASLQELAGGIDAFLYSLRYLRTGEIAAIPTSDDEPPGFPEPERRRLIADRFPSLGLYWTPLTSVMVAGEVATLSTADAIDDLTDIAAELSGVEWYLGKHGQAEALAALRWSYENHLHMHLLPLRTHLEDLMFGN